MAWGQQAIAPQLLYVLITVPHEVSKQDPFVLYNIHCNFGVDVDVDNQYISTCSWMLMDAHGCSWMLTIPVP
jgi:hypothetical protein